MTVQYADRVRAAVTSTGTGTLSLGAAVAPFRAFSDAVAAGDLSSGATVYYVIEDGALWEVGTGVYTAGSPDTLSRTPFVTSAGNSSAISVDTSAQVYITLTAQALATLATLASPALTGTPTAPTAAVGTATTQLATTGFVVGQAATVTPSSIGDAPTSGASTSYARADHAHIYTAPTRNSIDDGTTPLTWASSIAVAGTGNVFTLTLTGTGAVMANPTGLQPGAHYQFIIRQDATGGRTLAYSSNWKFANKTVPTLSTAANAIDLISAVSPDGSTLLCTFAPNFG